MADSGIDIMKLVNEALVEFDKVSKDKTLDPAIKKKAFDHYEDVLLLAGQHVISEYEGRTAILTGLIAELTAFTQTIQVENPIVGQVAQATAFMSLVDKARVLFDKEKAAKKG
jgi:hypothetical protein